MGLVHPCRFCDYTTESLGYVKAHMSHEHARDYQVAFKPPWSCDEDGTFRCFVCPYCHCEMSVHPTGMLVEHEHLFSCINYLAAVARMVSVS